MVIDDVVMDDDFEAVPISCSRRVEVGGCITGRDRVVFPRIYTRGRAGELRDVVRALTDVVRALTDVQKGCVREMGFGSLLEFDLWDTPTRLGYWLVDSFDARSRSLLLSTGERVRISDEDVAVTLGFPLGDVEMVRKSKSDAGRLAKLWRSLFGRNDCHITLSAVATEMLNCTDGGEWFKRHFAILVVTILIESMRNGFCNHHYMHHFDDVTAINKLNWCGLVVRSLISCKVDWDKHRSRAFTGPLVFFMVIFPHLLLIDVFSVLFSMLASHTLWCLQLFYVDRVVLYYRKVQRSIPVFRKWNSELLWERERDEVDARGFGHGWLDSPLCDQVVGVLEPSSQSERQSPQSQVLCTFTFLFSMWFLRILVRYGGIN